MELAVARGETGVNHQVDHKEAGGEGMLAWAAPSVRLASITMTTTG